MLTIDVSAWADWARQQLAGRENGQQRRDMALTLAQVLTDSSVSVDEDLAAKALAVIRVADEEPTAAERAEQMAARIAGMERSLAVWQHAGEEGLVRYYALTLRSERDTLAMLEKAAGRG